MLIDTSRNGWGGSARPTGPGATTSVDTYVDGGRYDRRIHVGNWCNQSGAGLGERPQAAPATGIDAYVWMKPPGESDGSSTAIANDEGKASTACATRRTRATPATATNMSGALANAPLSGHWFSAAVPAADGERVSASVGHFQAAGPWGLVAQFPAPLGRGVSPRGRDLGGSPTPPPN